MEHTKGKWEIMPCRERTGNLDIVVDTPCESGTFLGIIACCSKRNGKPAETQANARLIAAAPELLEACKNVANMACIPMICQALEQAGLSAEIGFVQTLKGLQRVCKQAIAEAEAK